MNGTDDILALFFNNSNLPFDFKDINKKNLDDTIYLTENGFSEPVGIYDCQTRTAKLTKSIINKSLVIDIDNVTLNGNNYSIGNGSLDIAVLISKNSKNISIEYLKLNSYNIKNKIKGNEIMLYRAFYNVIENSIKYNKINGSIDILCYQDLNTIEVKVIDTGSGIKEEDYDEIFKPFYRCEGINSYSKNGIGLGLSLTQSVIKLHGGEINVKSKLNEGTEFTFILPYIV